MSWWSNLTHCHHTQGGERDDAGREDDEHDYCNAAVNVFREFNGKKPIYWICVCFVGREIVWLWNELEDPSFISVLPFNGVCKCGRKSFGFILKYSQAISDSKEEISHFFVLFELSTGMSRLYNIDFSLYKFKFFLPPVGSVVISGCESRWIRKAKTNGRRNSTQRIFST